MVKSTDAKGPLKQLFLLGSLRTVFGTGLSSVRYACGIQGAADDMISGTRKIFYSSAADQDNAVLLEVMSLAGNVACYFNAVGKTYSGDLSER